jgi:glucokinase
MASTHTLIGIEIGGTKLQLAVGTTDGSIIELVPIPADRQGGGAGIRQQIAEALPPLLNRHRPSAIGVGFGGPIDWKTGVVCCSHQVEGWHDFPLGTWLTEVSGLPVRVDNDANVATLGEALFGAGRGFDPVFWINMGSGVGGGLVTQGKLYHGARPGEAEIGHVRLDKSGVLVEERCSGWALDRRVREAITAMPTGLLASLAGETTGGEARWLGPALEARDPVASAILSELADNVGFALSHVVQLFHPEIIVVGGGVSLLGEPLRAAIAESLPRYVMDSFQPGPKVVLPGLGQNSVPVGALALAASQLDVKTG